MEDKNYPLKTALLMTAGMSFLYILARYRRSIINKFCNPLRHKRLQVVDNLDGCSTIVDLLKKHCTNCQVLGFDCEWVSVGGKRRPVALLQLSSHEGLCALFRLNCMQHVPKSLRELLEDKNIVKVGVAADDDAKKLRFDYGVGTVSTIDLRYLAAIVGHKPDGIGGLAKSLLGIELDKNWRLACSNWEAKELSDKQLNYAANDALVGIEVFKKLANKFNKRIHWSYKNKDLNDLLKQLEPYYDVHYKESNIDRIVTRSKALYDYFLLEAPNGELLATINRNKAQWYIDQGLANVVSSNNGFTVRFNFHPLGRGFGDEDRYFQFYMEQRCVVCSSSAVHLRTKIEPHKYP